MLSAFGVDHGGVSKGVFRVPKPPRGMPGGRRATRAQRASRAQQAATPGGPSAGEQIKNAFSRAGEANISLKGIGAGAAKGTKAVGGFLEKRPGLTGTALVGGGGAAGYKVLSDKQPKKKKRF
jgi:hypothetical protein